LTAPFEKLNLKIGRWDDKLILKNVTRLGNPVDHINHWRESTFVDFPGGSASRTVKTSFPRLIASKTN
jgi:hypothetical protein